MAQELKIRHNEAPVKVRSPWAAALLPYVTLGVYHIVWWYRINGELRDYGRATGHDLGQSPAKSTLAAFPGCLLIVPALITYYRGAKRIQAAAQVAGQEPINGWVALALYLVLPAALWAYFQSSLNAVWRVEAVGSEASAAVYLGSDDRIDTPIAAEPAAGVIAGSSR